MVLMLPSRLRRSQGDFFLISSQPLELRGITVACDSDPRLVPAARSPRCSPRSPSMTRSDVFVLVYMPPGSAPVVRGAAFRKASGQNACSCGSGRSPWPAARGRHADLCRSRTRCGSRRRPAGPYQSRHRTSAAHPGGWRGSGDRLAEIQVGPTAISALSVKDSRDRPPSSGVSRRSKFSSRRTRFEPMGVACEPTTRLDDRAGCGSGAARTRIAAAVLRE
jgi:hypothetical protein